ncbi:glutamate racemase [Pajaroellobacter abortibovis]|uniref:Glutamate racemase n=1 Tax=Pajaroellobacter abortibovis TaxID=1882918 RepID=A0A1L6MWW1_9BACT|nr:glutamate racemase [Pajaroellobacter abortibovis]APS00027.1 glutamate racemase [Pajaroellobacter abortibovis]
MNDLFTSSLRFPSNSWLGVFDSGLGGLTVVRALRSYLPEEDILYLGDTAHVPYGTKSKTTIAQYALSCARCLVSKNAKAIIIACNTASAIAGNMLKRAIDVPILGVIESTARLAVYATKTGRIGVLGTAATIRSGAYPRMISTYNPHVTVIDQSAPLLVALAEEGWTDGKIAELTIQEYLKPFRQAQIDVILLACTHYPLLQPMIEQIAQQQIGAHVQVIDSATAVAHEASKLLMRCNLKKKNGGQKGKIKIFATDITPAFNTTVARFLQEDAPAAEHIKLSSFP